MECAVHKKPGKAAYAHRTAAMYKHLSKNMQEELTRAGKAEFVKWGNKSITEAVDEW